MGLPPSPGRQAASRVPLLVGRVTAVPSLAAPAFHTPKAKSRPQSKHPHENRLK